MKYMLYPTSRSAWRAMFSAITQAKKSIYIEMYAISDDTAETFDFLGQLKLKARQGLKVIIIADSNGSAELKEEIIKELNNVGIEFIFFSHWLRRTHRKILIVDEKIGFLGGVNIKKSFATWQDLQVKISGRLVKILLKSFAHTYALCHGKDRHILEYRQRSFLGKFNFWLLEHSPIRGMYSLRRYYQEKISHAQKSIIMVTPYFTPPRWLIAELDAAKRRGVEIKIIVPENTDISIVNRINYYYFTRLANLGIVFYLSHKMNHAKVFLIDGEEALIGSQNIDFLSFDLNAEVGLFFRDKALIADLTKIIDGWLRNAVLFRADKFKANFLDYFLILFAKVFWPFL